MAFPPLPVDANVGGAISDPNEHPGHHNALAAAVNDIVEHVSTLEGGGGGSSLSVTYYDGVEYPSRDSVGLAEGEVWWVVNAIDGTVPSDAVDGDILLRMAT